jgi:hypothetical protein
MMSGVLLNFTALGWRSDTSGIAWGAMYLARTLGIFCKLKIVMPQERKVSDAQAMTMDTHGSRNGSFTVASHAALNTFEMTKSNRSIHSPSLSL